MVKCSAKGCKNYTKKDSERKVRYFALPKTKELREKWISCCEKYVNVEHARICSDHFLDSDYQLQDSLLNTPLLKRRLKENAEPTQNLKLSAAASKKKLANECREKRLKRRVNKKMVEEILLGQYDTSPKNDEQKPIKIEVPDEILESNGNHDAGTQTEVDLECARELKIMELEKLIRKLKSENKGYVKRLKNLAAERKHMEKIFTKGQLRRMQSQNASNLHWSPEDICSAFALYSVGPRAYEQLLERQFPLPSASTLKRWATKMKLHQGRQDTFEQVSDCSDVDNIPVSLANVLTASVLNVSGAKVNPELNVESSTEKCVDDDHNA